VVGLAFLGGSNACAGTPKPSPRDDGLLQSASWLLKDISSRAGILFITRTLLIRSHLACCLMWR
jgi:hypothetical protein